MENLSKLGVCEIKLKEARNLDGGWILGLLNLVAGATYMAYNLGKDSYQIHPESLI
ncbi:hypothetical protein [Flagellimonas sediminis]|uniref:Uncharacterized protein n=1 Tax=Flagellimonas sediminis TaxID=2696468 RepID=A0A6I5KSA5_9FLAO|nr:hypothetical protein [Allomuricauda sediminis]NDV42845.1 hypothetical protein [Allomuricauda sediminis]